MKNTILLKDNNQPLSNVGMGWVTHVYCGDTKDYNEIDEREFIDNVALLYTWEQIEVSENNFDFSKVDAKVAYHTSRSQYIHFRISTDPMIYNGAKGVPSYVFDKYNVKYFERDDYGCIARFPDYLDKNYQMCLKRFLNAFKNHYKDNPYILQVDLRGYGEWGEWHSGYMHETRKLHNKALNEVIQIWVDAFKDTNITLAISSSYEWRADLPLELHAPKSYKEFKYFQGFDKLNKYPNVSFRRDGIGGALRVYDKQIMDEHYFSKKKGGITAEFFSPYLKAQVMPDGVRGYHVEDALEEALQIHPNSMMVMWDSNQFYHERPDLVKYILTRIGFRLFPKKTVIDCENNVLNIRQYWTNTGVGKYPYDGIIELKLVGKNETIVKKITDFNLSNIHENETKSLNINLDYNDELIGLEVKVVSNNGITLNMPLDGGNDGFYKLF